MHRTGEYGRIDPNVPCLPAKWRCLTVDEMRAAGMLRDRRGLWITKAFEITSPFVLAAGASREGWGM
ncbi:hypothetical protein WK80_20515 [Burkholderia multivorans]|nr:hypothetical protein WK80_20515 [Burkholderia multivorans]OXH89837.1 hypothetical protein CA830_16950 [Burkholderia multivorans]